MAIINSIDYRDYMLADCVCPDCGSLFQLRIHKTHYESARKFNGRVPVRCGACAQKRLHENDWMKVQK